MITRDIVCLNCGFAGLLDVHCENHVVPEGILFHHLGHNPYSGDLHFRCPACEIVLLVDPGAVLGEESLSGLPGRKAALSARQKGGYRSGRQGLLRWFDRTEGRA